MNKGKALFEIFLVIMSVVSFSYIVGETNDLFVENEIKNVGESKFISFLRWKVLDWLSGGIVSAQELLWTCLEDNNGTICQEYPSSECADINVCPGGCVESARENTAECRIGTCFDPLIGTCSDGSPKLTCENSGGTWNPLDGICNRNCCLINPDGNGGAGQTQYTTEQQCNYLSGAFGSTPVEWVSVNNELECLLLSNTQEEGACILELIPEEGKYNCEFATKSVCLGSGGEFFKNKLCTAEDLEINGEGIETICEITQETNCFEGRDEVYFIDSCGNRGNIYDSNKLAGVYWNDVVPISESCSLGTISNNFGNQKSCGSCGYLLGSICGKPVSGKDDNANYGDYVCKDLRCVDYQGETRKNGESWCRFDGQIGVDETSSNREGVLGNICDRYLNPTGTSGNQFINWLCPPGSNGRITSDRVCQNATMVAENPELEGWCNYEEEARENQGSNEERSVDTPGSAHYTQTCFDGEIRTESCSAVRSKVCVENKNEEIDFSSASCRANTWQVCYAANGDKNKLNKCEENTDCFLKHVDVDEFFKFDLCVPKYPPGFDKESRESSAEGLCSSLGSQTCTYIEEKFLGSWDCVANCGCAEPKFAETMNNLCMSLGDCGASVNYNGELSSDGYNVVGGNGLSDDYLNGLRKYSTPIPGQSADALSGEEILAIFGIDPVNADPSQLGALMGQIGLGSIGVATMYFVLIEGIPIAAITSGAVAGAGAVSGAATAAASGVGAAAGAGEAVVAGVPKSLGPFGSAAGGAAAGAAIAYILGTVFGLEGKSLNTLVIAGAVVGAVMGYLAFETTTFVAKGASFGAALGPFLFWTILIIVVIAVILSLLGGETREVTVDFSCLPWQPPSGGQSCEECDSDDLGCSEYKCNSLGQNCELLNEGTSEQTCVDINPNDTSPPVIDKWDDVISDGFEYKNSVINVGTEIQSVSGDGCIKEFSLIEFGISLDEPGQCKYSFEHTNTYDEMEMFFGKSNSYKENHDALLTMPSLSDLGVGGVGPDRRENYNMFVRCQDSSGNDNSAEYAIKFCVKPADDKTPAVITKFVPENPGYAGFEAENFSLTFFTNEPAECKWSPENKGYDEMENLAACSNGINQGTINGWSCLANLPVQGNETESYYFKCEDQPWLGINNTDRNKADQEKEYQIKKTLNPLVIDYIYPDDEIVYSGSAFAVIDLEIHTSGGVNNNAICEHKSSNVIHYSGFFPTGGEVHLQKGLTLPNGNYEYELKCTDSAGNVALETANFEVKVDNKGPIASRIYSSGNVLNIVTNEPAVCTYTNTNCGFSFDSGELMSGENYLHTTPFDLGLVYRIKCRDIYENVGSCLTISGGY
ncbi:MAG: hypothetical protein Q8P57_05050 [Candidatus Pacearchaeota archaeon]|nr:hypothetical protein [Candidatus Pacearchaeota archaeon]